MSKALFYTYRNLNRGTAFSTKHRGLVMRVDDHPTVIRNARFQVSDAGRERTLRDKKRNVHAFIVSSEPPEQCDYVDHAMLEISYNPYVAPGFFYKGVGRMPHILVEQVSPYIILQNGRCYLY